MLSIKYILLFLFCYLIQDCTSSSYLFSFFLVLLGGLELNDAWSVDGRHDKQLHGRIPQLCKSPSSLFEPASTQENSSRKTGSFASFTLLSHLPWEFVASVGKYLCF